MEGKKRYIALVIFLFLALMIFTFANPGEEDKEFTDGGNKEQTEQVDKNEQTKEENTENQENNQTENNQVKDNSYETALAAVEKAEASYKQDDVDAAKELVNKVTDPTKKGELEDRLDEVEAGIEVMSLIQELEYQVAKSENKDDLNDAKDYRDEHEVAEKVAALTNEKVKEALQERLDKVSKILDDDKAPVVNIENNQAFKENTTIEVEDEAGNDFTIYLSKDGEEKEEIENGTTTTSEGIYELTVVDKAFNEETIRFVVDGTNPKFNGLTSGKHYEEIKIAVEDLSNTTITISKDHTEKTSVDNNTTITEEGTYEITATDEAGNTTTVWVAVDKTAPTIERTDEVEYPTSDQTVTVKDKFLTAVKVEGPEFAGTYTRDDFTVGEHNENFAIEFNFTKEGTYTINATDKFGYVTKETFTIDKTAPVINGLEEGKYFYNTSVKPELVEENIASYTLNGEEYDGKEITKDGYYTLVAIDKAGQKREVKFAIDQTAPIITGVEDNKFYNTTVKPGVEDANLAYVTINKLPYVPGVPVFLYGKYELVAVDKAGNSTTVNFTIDTIAPKVLLLDRIEYISGKYLPIKPVILEQYIDTIVMKKDGEVIPYEKGQQLTDDAKYEMTVTDKAGNTTTVEFTMDSVSPTAMVKPAQLGVVSELDLNNLEVIDSLDDLNLALLNKDILLTEDAEFILLKKEKSYSILDKEIPIYKPITMPADKKITEEGEYVLIAYDKAYNLTAIKFTVDKTAPVINAEDGKYYSKLTIDVEDANLSSITIKKNGTLIGTRVENGYVLDKEGTYEITAKDIIGENILAKEYKEHITTVTVHIDTNAPTANVVNDGVYEKVKVTVEDVNLDKESITINGNKYDGKELTEEGNYKLVAKDLAGNKLEVNFEIDNTPITISGVEEDKNYNTDKTITVTARDENAVVKLNGVEITKEYLVTEEGKNTIKVTDKWGNEEQVTFIIDKTRSTIVNPFASETNKIGARKDSSKNVEALVTDNIDVDKYIKPVVKHSKKGNMGQLSTIPTTKEYAGKYTLIYNTKDAAGNSAIELVVHVEVIENDYVITFVDVDNNNFTYTYGDKISNFKVKIYSDITEDYVTYDESDITYEIVGGTTIANAGTYTVKATANATKFPNTEVAEQVITVKQKEVELEFVKTNGTTTVNEYEFDGQTNPFTAKITTQLVGEDVVTPTVTYSTSTFGPDEEYVATASLNNANYKIKANDETHTFKIVKANAQVTLPLTANGTVKVVNKDNQDITQYATVVISDEKVATATQTIGIFNKKTYEISMKYKTIQVIGNDYMNVATQNQGLTGLDSFKTIINGLKLMGINVFDDLQTEITKNIPTGTSKAYITDVSSKQK